MLRSPAEQERHDQVLAVLRQHIVGAIACVRELVAMENTEWCGAIGMSLERAEFDHRWYVVDQERRREDAAKRAKEQA